MKKYLFVGLAGACILAALILLARPQTPVTPTPTPGTTQKETAVFIDRAQTFSFSYPTILSVVSGDTTSTQDWSKLVQTQTLGTVLAKINFDRSIQPQTNFSGAEVQIGNSSDPKDITACATIAPNGNPGIVPVQTATINGVVFTKLAISSAGAGNYYDTTSYRTIRNNKCYSVEYTIHSTNIGNYSPDQGIKEFDKPSITKTLEDIVQSFRFL